MISGPAGSWGVGMFVLGPIPDLSQNRLVPAWSLYSDLGLPGGIIGLALTLGGFHGFSRVPGHSADWNRKSPEAILCFYAVCGALATLFSAINCPATTKSNFH